MKDVAIIASVIPQRFELLSRSLVTWQKSILDSELDACIYLYIEGISVQEAMIHIPDGVGVTLAGTKERSGSHCKGYNYWHDIIDAKVYLFTHPDLLYPKNTVRTAFDNAKDNTFVAFKCFWMSPNMTRDIEQFDWQHPETLEQEPRLIGEDAFPQGNFYSNSGVRQITRWESSTTYAINRQTAERLYPLPDFGHQVSDDPYQAGARARLGITNYTVQDPILFHQWHPNSRTITGEQAVEEAQAELIKRFGR